MLRGFLNKSIGLLLLGSIASSTTAADLKVRVADGGGKPLADAVASLRPASGLASAAAAGTTAIMDQRNLQFAPHVLPIQAGTKISMPNSDQVRHHVYSFSPAKHFKLRMYKERPGADSVEKSIVLAVDPPQAQEPPSELELKFRRYQGKPDAP